MTADYRTVPDLPVGRIEVICYRSDGEHMDDSLRLVFPHLVTDQRGMIAMPVYKSVHAIAARDEPDDLQTEHPDLDVFQFPGRIGSLPSALVIAHPDAPRN